MTYKVRNRWRMVNGQNETNSDNLVGAERNLDAGLQNLLDDEPKAKSEDKPVTKKSNTEDAVDLESLLNDF